MHSPNNRTLRLHFSLPIGLFYDLQFDYLLFTGRTAYYWYSTTHISILSTEYRRKATGDRQLKQHMRSVALATTKGTPSESESWVSFHSVRFLNLKYTC